MFLKEAVDSYRSAHVGIGHDILLATYCHSVEKWIRNTIIQLIILEKRHTIEQGTDVNML